LIVFFATLSNYTLTVFGEKTNWVKIVSFILQIHKVDHIKFGYIVVKDIESGIIEN